MKLKYFLIIGFFPILCFAQVVKDFKQVPDGIKVTLEDGILGIHALTDDAVRIRFCKDDEIKIPELIFSSEVSTPEFKVNDSPAKLELKTKKIIVAIDKKTGLLSYTDKSGKIFLSEKAGTRKLIPDSVMSEPCFKAEQSFESSNDEYLFGLGQFQDGHYNLKNVTRRLTQVNSQISIPFIYSCKGYGLLWHQYGLTDFNPAHNFVALENMKSHPLTTIN